MNVIFHQNNMEESFVSVAMDLTLYRAMWPPSGETLVSAALHPILRVPGPNAKTYPFVVLYSSGSLTFWGTVPPSSFYSLKYPLICISPVTYGLLSLFKYSLWIGKVSPRDTWLNYRST
jgi:hypothetical protein